MISKFLSKLKSILFKSEVSSETPLKNEKKVTKSAKTKTIIDYGELRGTLNMVENYKNSNNKIYNTDDNLAFKAGTRLLKPRSKKQAQYFK